MIRLHIFILSTPDLVVASALAVAAAALLFLGGYALGRARGRAAR